MTNHLKLTTMLEYFNEVPYSVTVCDKDGKILEMNDMAVNVLSHAAGAIIL